jgi:mRNA-degrading endonuclease HigB of HigAB toxin-antitoxin module
MTKSARIKIDNVMLFELLGLKYFDGTIESACVEDDTIVFDLSGNDYRLPEPKFEHEYPDSIIACQTIQSHIERL